VLRDGDKPDWSLERKPRIVDNDHQISPQGRSSGSALCFFPMFADVPRMPRGRITIAEKSRLGTSSGLGACQKSILKN
jgi:hypothetical protein